MLQKYGIYIKSVTYLAPHSYIWTHKFSDHQMKNDDCDDDDDDGCYDTDYDDDDDDDNDDDDDDDDCGKKEEEGDEEEEEVVVKKYDDGDSMNIKSISIQVGMLYDTFTLAIQSQSIIRQGDLRLSGLQPGRAPVAGLEPATEESLQISGRTKDEELNALSQYLRKSCVPCFGHQVLRRGT
ncbi:hypothetical protein PoB_002138000 [Plakobranchus ocellatus]|uniref:Uncharacterized protein n=1 Tax=Plakobranchus ocellatus TaxID=259542 RepID=A0AAV3ZIB8_9GAST|nr:hypothetical protein PoB_002138000 [Plakobranchus ocellatus]